MRERREERRLVTCLFIDVVGSTEMTVRLGPERLKNTLGEAFGELRDLIAARGGTVEKYVGDAIYALFGAPVAHPDDPERALRVAEDCLRWAERRERDLVPFAVRVGVETGEAIVDLEAADKARQQMSVGAVVNIAARLQQRGEPGQALVGPTCREATAEVAELTFVGDLDLKGIGTLAAWSLVRVAPAAPRARLPFVGRASELELLGMAHRRARSGRSVLALVSGPPGQGKTRLVEEFVLALEPSAHLLRVARCRPGGETGALAPYRQVLGDAAGDAASLAAHLVGLFDEASERDRVHAALAYSAGLAASAALDRLGPPEREDEIVNGWRRYLAALGAGRLVVIWVEDLHWAERSVVRTTDRMTLSGIPLLVIATARPEFAEAAGLRPSGDRFFIELEGLEPEAAQALAASAGRADESAVARAEGNPLFIVELARGQSAGGALPLTLQGALGARLDELASDDRALLSRAAVVGETFGAEDAAALAERPLTETSRALVRLADLHYLQEVDSGYRFHHSLLRDVAYGRLLAADRLRLHARHARERVHPEDAERLAHHWWEALRPPDAEWVWRGHADLAAMRREAFAAHLAGGRQYAEGFAVERAVELLERALALADGPADQAEAERAIGAAYSKILRGDEAWDHFGRALQAYRGLGSVPTDFYPEMLHVATAWGAFKRTPEVDALAALSEEAERVARERGDRTALARVLVDRVETALNRGVVEPEWMAATLDEALRAAEESGDRDTLARVLQAKVWYDLHTGDVRQTGRLMEELERQIVAGAHIDDQQYLRNRSALARYLGDLATAGEFAERASAGAEAMGPHLKTHAWDELSETRFARGDWPAVAELASRAERAVLESPQSAFCASAGVLLRNGAVAHALAGRREEATAVLRTLDRLTANLDRNEVAGLPLALLGIDAPPLETGRGLPGTARWEMWLAEAARLLILGRFDAAERAADRLTAVAAGAPMIRAIVEALREEIAAERGGPAPAHTALRAMGLQGWSQILRRRASAEY